MINFYGGRIAFFLLLNLTEGTELKTKKPNTKDIEQYDHKGKERVNIPPVGLVTPDTDRDMGRKSYEYDPHIDPALQFDSNRSAIENIIDNGLAAERLEDAKAALSELQRRQDPYLNWAGKAEHTSFDVTTLSLHVHERIDPITIISALRRKDDKSMVQVQLSFFEAADENPPLREAIEFYKHKHNWSNRIIAGDSLLVMNSLIEKEGLAGQVQMIYIDPPYGIRYGSNFQPFVNKRDVRDGNDTDLTQEPEMIKAYRDAWELGIHSYLTYLRDRLLLARELLADSGSVFIQINDSNLSLVNEVATEVLKKDNLMGIIAFLKTSGFSSKFLPSTFDFLLWYAKDKKNVKYHQLYFEKKALIGAGELYNWVELPDGNRRRFSKEEKEDFSLVPEQARVFRLDNFTSQGGTAFPIELGGKTVWPGTGLHWKTNPAGIERLKSLNRLVPSGKTIMYIRYLDDFPLYPVSNLWADTRTGSFTDPKLFVVQTGTKVVSRCILMTTDPGDLIFDPTCGSGTTAYVAEKWGRRWMTCDTSRISITLSKQRLMTALFDYYELYDRDEGVDSGFSYRTVPHITLKSVANDEPPAIETLFDQPHIDRSKIRVSGPFTVEAVPSPIVKPISDVTPLEGSPDQSIVRSDETLRQEEWRDELLNTGIRGKSGQYLRFSRVEPLSGTIWLHADAETKEDVPKRAVISFGPAHAPLEQRQVALAIEEALSLVPQPKIVAFASFHFDPEAAKDIDETTWPGVTLLKVQMNADLLTDDLKKKRVSNESFWLIGQPDVRIEKIGEGINVGKYKVEVFGFDYYNTKTGNIESGGPDKIAMWMLDTDYDGRSIFPRQVFFPLADAKGGWSRLARSLKAEINLELVEAYRSTVSLPFEVGSNRRVAVKIIDDRGIESLRIIEVE